MGFVDEHTVLLLVAPMDFAIIPPRADDWDETWHLVSWDFRTDDYRRLATGPEPMRTVEVAIGLIR